MASRIPSGEYEQYKKDIQYITAKGTKEMLERLYHEIILKYGRDCPDLKMLDDNYNSKWRIL